MSGIELRNVYKDYDGDVRAVTNFSLKVDDGEFVVLVGPSGCGKSTVLRMMAGLEDVTAGEIIIEDKVINNVHPKNRDIAMVFQNYALYPHMTVEENMAFGLKMKKLDEKSIEKRVKNSAEIIGLSDFLDRLPRELSGGQSQRVALGRAIVRDPKIFLMDEPLSNLDAKLRAKTRAELIQLSRRLNVTTVYVTHDQVEAMTMADRIAIMDHGVLQQVGTPREIYLYPINKFVANFMGSPPMNLINVVVTPQGFKRNGEMIKAPKIITDYLVEAGYENKELTMGIRPENIHLIEDAPENAKEFNLEASINLPEMLGSETLLHIDVLNTEMVVKSPTMEEFEIGQKEIFAIDYDFIHFFETSTGIRLTPPEPEDTKRKGV